MTYYVGIDLHRKRSQLSALDEVGNEVLARRIQDDPEMLREVLSELDGDLEIADALNEPPGPTSRACHATHRALGEPRGTSS
jgi:hypothetical protein